MASRSFSDIDPCAEWILKTAGPDIRLALPLGLGKANRLANAIYRRVEADPGLRLTIITALTLEVPPPGSELEHRFLEPFNRRVFGDYPKLLYAADRRAGRLPANVEVHEFYMAPGEMLGNPHAQQHYISSNYTHVTRDLVERDVNVIAQLVTRRMLGDGRERYSLSCNPDLTLDVAERQRGRNRPLVVAAEVNDNLPFMYGDAVVEPDFFDAVAATPGPHFRLFGPPKTPVSSADHLIGLHASTLVRDGGTLQVGIGSLGDAVVSALKMRHEDNRLYRTLLTECGVLERCREPIERVGDLAPFRDGLYGATEMLVDGFLHLYQAGILKRRVYHNAGLQRLLNEHRIEDAVSCGMLQTLAEAGLIGELLSRDDVRYLKQWGIFRPQVHYDDGDLVTPGGGRLIPDLGDPAFRERLEAECLGDQLANGVVASAGFFLGPSQFYRALHELPEDERRLINMTSVLRVNHLYDNVELDTLQRREARFINSALLVTLTGAVVSDGLEDQRVVSGVGGQFDFITMAHALPDGRSIVTLRSTRESGGRTTSNIRFSYGHTTIPRHLRDFVVTEYGIADLRGKSDAGTVAAMLNVTDSRFQGALLKKARKAGKLPHGYRIPERYRDNYPEKLEQRLANARREGWCPAFPFGTDLTQTEQRLSAALQRLRDRAGTWRGRIEAAAAVLGSRPERHPEELERLALNDPVDWREWFYARLIAGELERDA